MTQEYLFTLEGKGEDGQLYKGNHQIQAIDRPLNASFIHELVEHWCNCWSEKGVIILAPKVVVLGVIPLDQ